MNVFRAATAPAAVIGKSRIVDVMLFYFRIFGLWRPHSSRSYALYSYALHFTCTFMYMISLIAGLFALRTNDEIIHATAMTLTLIAVNVRVANLHIYNERIRKCLCCVIEFPLNDEDADERAYVRRSVHFFTVIAGTQYVCGNTAGISQYVASYMKGSLPFTAWYPSADRMPQLWYWYQVGGMCMLSNLNMTLELFPCYLIHMCSVKLRLLDARLRSLGQGCRAERVHGFGVAMNEMPEQKTARQALIGCIRTHQAIVKCVAALQSGFEVPFFVQTIAMTAIICASAIQLTMSSPRDDPAGYAFLVCFSLAIGSSSSMPCFFGNTIITCSDQLSSALYASEWTQMSARFRRLLVVFMVRVRRPSVMQACKMFPLSLDTFRTIMSFTYKLYALVANTN